MTGPAPQAPASYAQTLIGARLDMEAAERALAVGSRAFLSEQDRQNLTRSSLAEALPRGTAIVSYAVMP